ncbi:MAG: PKD domain-containing protein, partial [Methanotrichaceae archaeon]
TATFTVVATGSSLTYQWYQSTNSGTTWSGLSGQTATTLTLTNVATGMSGYQYHVVIKRSGCSDVTSSAATLTVVTTATSITAQPSSQTTATFTVVATGSSLTYQWYQSTNSGTTWSGLSGQTATTLTLTSVTTGMSGYQYHVVVTGTCGSVTSNAATLTVNPTTSITTQPSSQTVCVGSTATFTVAATGSSLTYQWQQSTNSGTSWSSLAGQTTAILTLTSVTTGMSSYQYRVVVTGTCGSVTSNAATLVVNQPPTADFTATSTSGCAPLTVIFTDASNGNGQDITGWTWDFGDTTTYSGQTSPAHIYSSPGTYTVRLTVTTSCGTNTMTKTGYITAYGPPTADFTTTSTSGCSPLTVTFANTSNGNGRTITGWTWDFGDTTTYSGQTPPAHIYSSPGTYTVRLTVTTSCGTNTMTKTGYITAYGPPTANFTATPISGCPPMTVTFANTSNGNGRTITSWAWNFGDSTNYNGQTPPAHIYSNKGTYTVKLTVTSACGTDTKTAYVTVSQPVVVPGSYGPACVSGSSITLVGSPGGGTWFGDGVLGNIFNPAVSGPGNHVLTYQYTSGSSCSFSNTTTLTVVPLPQTTITVG